MEIIYKPKIHFPNEFPNELQYLYYEVITSSYEHLKDTLNFF